jgi:hypothetical protein
MEGTPPEFMRLCFLCTQVEDLLIARITARKRRDFDRADSIKMQLRAMGVEIWDEERCERFFAQAGLQLKLLVGLSGLT